MLTSHLFIFFMSKLLKQSTSIFNVLSFKKMSMKYFEMLTFLLGWRWKLFSKCESVQTGRISGFLPKLAMKPSVHNSLRCQIFLLILLCSQKQELVSGSIWAKIPSADSECLQIRRNHQSLHKCLYIFFSTAHTKCFTWLISSVSSMLK